MIISRCDFTLPTQIYSTISNQMEKLAAFSLIDWLDSCRDAMLRSLLSDHSWKVNPHTISAKIKYIAIRILSIGKRSVDSFERALPKLPTPRLKNTVRHYLDSIRSLVPPEQYQETERLAEDFMNGVGGELQSRLEAYASGRRNWVEEIWERDAYLKNRGALPLTTNYYGLDSIEPSGNVYEDPSVGRMSRLGFLITRYLDSVRKRTCAPTLYRGVPLSMDPAKRLAGAVRIPGVEMDHMEYHPNSKHIVVAYRDRLFKVPVIGDDGSLIRETELAIHLQHIKRTVGQSQRDGTPVGVLTGQDRPTWFHDRERLKELGNTGSLQEVEGSLFMICLDEEDRPDLQTLSEGLFKNASNRWFDKIAQFVGFQNAFGGHFEHTAVDATIIAEMQDALYRDEAYVVGESLPPPRENIPEPEEIRWNLDEEMQAHVYQVQNDVQERLDNIDLRLMAFDEFGKKSIQKQGLSPDSFIQMAVQWTYWRLRGEQTFTYETASTRMFAGGRTETIRTASPESLALVQALDSEEVSREEKIQLLKKAIRVHKKTASAAYLGNGCDRHLLALKAMVQEGEHVPFFDDPSFQLPLKLATSQTPCPNSAGGCFLPSAEDGYGVSYHVEKTGVQFHITSFHSAAETTSEGFAEMLSRSLSDLMALLTQTDAG